MNPHEQDNDECIFDGSQRKGDWHVNTEQDAKEEAEADKKAKVQKKIEDTATMMCIPQINLDTIYSNQKEIDERLVNISVLVRKINQELKNIKAEQKTLAEDVGNIVFGYENKKETDESEEEIEDESEDEYQRNGLRYQGIRYGRGRGRGNQGYGRGRGNQGYGRGRGNQGYGRGRYGQQIRSKICIHWENETCLYNANTCNFAHGEKYLGTTKQ